MVKNRKPIPSNKLMVIMFKRSGKYYLVTSFVGTESEPEVFNTLAFQRSDDFKKVKQRSIKFWSNHTLIEE